MGRILGGVNETEDAISVCCIKELRLGKARYQENRQKMISGENTGIGYTLNK